MRRSAEDLSETIVLGGLHSLCGNYCGCEASICVIRAASVGSHDQGGRSEMLLSTPIKKGFVGYITVEALVNGLVA